MCTAALAVGSPTISHKCKLRIPRYPYLVLNSPFAYIVKVLALVLRVEVWEGRGAVLIEPDLAENPRVGVTH